MTAGSLFPAASSIHLNGSLSPVNGGESALSLPAINRCFAAVRPLQFFSPRLSVGDQRHITLAAGSPFPAASIHPSVCIIVSCKWRGECPESHRH